MVKRTKIKQAMLSLFIVALFLNIWGGVSGQAVASQATVTWTLPTHTVSNADCAVNGYPIPATMPLVTVVRWRVQGATTWTVATTAAGVRTYTITNLVPATSYEVQVGAKYEGSTTPPLCYTSSTLFTTPGYEQPRPCSSVVVTQAP